MVTCWKFKTRERRTRRICAADAAHRIAEDIGARVDLATGEVGDHRANG